MNRTLPVLGALLIVYVVWGTTYLGIKVAVATIPPFLMAGTRFLAAGLLVYGWCRLRGAPRPARGPWIDAAKVGALLLLGGNGLVCWAEQRLASGIAALLVATVPLWMILLGLRERGARRPGAVVLGGVLLGLSGIALLVLPGGRSGRVDPLGVLAMLAAALSWALGSLASRRARHPESPLMGVGMQMIAGGALLLAASLLTREGAHWSASQVTARSLWGVGYLVVFGSIVAYNAYIWLLKHADPTWVSTYAFVNPVVAVFLGWLVLDERLGPAGLWATLVILGSVGIITVERNRTR